MSLTLSWNEGITVVGRHVTTPELVLKNLLGACTGSCSRILQQHSLLLRRGKAAAELLSLGLFLLQLLPGSCNLLLQLQGAAIHISHGRAELAFLFSLLHLQLLQARQKRAVRMWFEACRQLWLRSVYTGANANAMQRYWK